MKSVKPRAAKPAQRPILNYADFNYLDMDLRVTLPQLVLGIKVHDYQFKSESPFRSYKFKPGRKWINIAHQTSGIMCGQFYMIGTLLEPKSVEVLRGMQQLGAKWLDSNVGWGTPYIDTLIEYRDDLTRLLKADCNRSHGDFAEGIYPVDLEFLPNLAANCPDINVLDEEIEWESGLDRCVGSIGRWSCYVMAENSD